MTPEPRAAPRFHRGLDGRIYHHPPIAERLTVLGNRFRNSTGRVALMVTLPIAVIVLAVCAVFFLMLGGGFTLVSLAGVPVVIVLIAGTYLLFQYLFRSKLSGQHDRTMQKLVHTDLALLIADESSWQRVHEQAAHVPQLRWLGIPTVRSFEDCILFAASYLGVIEGFSSGPEPALPRRLRHGSCLSWLATRQAATIGWLVTASCLVPFLGSLIWVMVFPLVAGANRYCELGGNVTAICDFFLADMDRQN